MSTEVVDFSPLQAAIQKTKILSFDLEARAPDGGKASDSLNPRKAVPTLVSIASDDHAEIYDIGLPEVREFVRSLFLSPDLSIIIQNTLYDVILLHSQKIIQEHEITARLIEMMVYQFLIDEESPKDLKDTVRRWLSYRMVTYKEATVDNPDSIEKQRLIDQKNELQNSIKLFHKKRPWPTFDSERVKTVAEVKTGVKTALATRWPGTPNSSGKTVYTKEESKQRSEFRDANEALIEKHFGFAAEMDYAYWINQVKIPEIDKQIIKIDQKLTKKFRKYAKDDSLQLLRLWKKLDPIARNGTKVNLPISYWVDIELLAREISTKASCRGTPINAEVLSDLSTIIDPLIGEFAAEVENEAKGFCNEDGSPLNPNSTSQLRNLLFNVLGCSAPEYKITPEGRKLPKLTPVGEEIEKRLLREGKFVCLSQPETLKPLQNFLSCDSEVLERVAHPIGMKILNLRTAEKIKSTYIESMKERLSQSETGRVAGLLDSIGTGTGRFSCSDPNLQNIPSRSKSENYDKRVAYLGMKIRNAFWSGGSHKKLIVADHSQVELRLIAHECSEPNLLSVYRRGVEVDGVFHYTGDVHTETAQSLRIPRKLAKNVNFGFNYGMRARKFARQIRLFKEGTMIYDIQKADEWRNGFFAKYQMIEATLQDYDQLWSSGVVNYRMISGRLRHFNPDDYVAGGRILNAKIQGSSADLIKVAIVVIEKYVRPYVPSLELCFQVHDELVYLADSDEAELAGMLIKYVMEYSWFPWISVPILASAKVCETWAAKDNDDLPEIGVYYACVNNQHRTFTPQTWHQFRAEEKAKTPITAKGATAILSVQQRQECEARLNPERIRAVLGLPDRESA